MKKLFFKGIAGVLAAVLVALVYLPFNVQAASVAPAVSLVADWYNTPWGTFVILTNKGTLGTGVNGHTWMVYEKVVDGDLGIGVLDYSESRTNITEPIYVNTDNFRKDAPNILTLIVTSPDLGYSYTCKITIKNKEAVGSDFHIVTSASGVLYNGQSNNTLDGYKNDLGALARASVNAFMPAGYMPACEGAITFNFTKDYKNKNGVVCFKIPEGYQADNRVFKLMTIGEGGAISICDDLDVNPATISALVNFNGFAVVLIYTETVDTTPVAPAPATAIPTGSAGTINQLYNYINNYRLVETVQGAQCMNTFTMVKPAGYTAWKTYSLYVNNTADVSPKNGYITFNVSNAFSDYKLITIDKNGAVQILNDCDANPTTVTFLLNYSGYACQLIAK